MANREWSLKYPEKTVISIRHVELPPLEIRPPHPVVMLLFKMEIGLALQQFLRQDAAVPAEDVVDRFDAGRVKSLLRQDAEDDFCAPVWIFGSDTIIP